MLPLMISPFSGGYDVVEAEAEAGVVVVVVMVVVTMMIANIFGVVFVVVCV